MVVLDCGGKRSATPLLAAYDARSIGHGSQCQSGVAAALCHRNPKTGCYGLAGFDPANKFTIHATDSVSIVPINVNHGQNTLCSTVWPATSVVQEY